MMQSFPRALTAFSRTKKRIPFGPIMQPTEFIKHEGCPFHGLKPFFIQANKDKVDREEIRKRLIDLLAEEPKENGQLN